MDDNANSSALLGTKEFNDRATADIASQSSKRDKKKASKAGKSKRIGKPEEKKPKKRGQPAKTEDDSDEEGQEDAPLTSEAGRTSA